MDILFKEIVVTLFEKKYHLGVAALINSLFASKFEGLIYVGYKGNLPNWVLQLESLDNGYYKINNIYIKFSKVDTLLHFGYYKPIALSRILDEYPFVEKVYYFDPDIVVIAPWIFFSEWLNNGISLCLDNCFPFVHHNHPWRQSWLSLSSSLQKSNIDYYVNSGFIGIKRKDKILLDRWIDITNKFELNGGDTTQFKKDGHSAFKTDQDLLNAVISFSPDLKISIIGKEGMGFTQPAYLMSHAVNDVKPWDKNYLRFLVSRGQRPDFMDKEYIKFANTPIKVFSNRFFKLKKINLRLATILGRIIN